MTREVLLRTGRAKLIVALVILPGLGLVYLVFVAKVGLEIHLCATLAYYAAGVVLSLLAHRQAPATSGRMKIISAMLFGPIWLLHMISVLLGNWQPHLRELSILQTIYVRKTI